MIRLLAAFPLLLASSAFADTPQKALNAAASKGDATQIQQLLDAGAFVNGTDGDSTWTPLCYAVNAGQLEAAQLLYERRGDLRMPCSGTFGGSLLAMAAGKENAEILRWLLKAQTWTDAEKAYAWSRAQRPDAMQALLDAGVGVDDSNGSESKLYNFAWQGNLEGVKFLVSKGADPDYKAGHGETPLMRVVGHESDRGGVDYDSVAEYLISTGRVDVNAASYGGTVLAYAARAGNVKAIERLLAAGARVDGRNPESDSTPLMVASSAEAAQALLDRGASVNAVDKKGRTALIYLFESDVPQRKDKAFLAAALLDHHADPDVKDRVLGYTALHYAAYRGDMAGVAQLAQSAGNIDEPSLPVTDSGRTRIVGGSQTPLMLAALSQKKDIVMYLLLAGADPKAADALGLSVADYARRDGRVTVGGRPIYPDLPTPDPDIERFVKNPPRLPAKKRAEHVPLAPIRAALNSASTVRW